jgi:glycosyltransferase involved in cell wall biosynthesis
LAALPAVVRAFPEALMTIVGDGAPEYRAQLSQVIRDKGLENNVLMTGRLDGDVKWGAYASSELFLLPSRQENFAITVAEAMQMGVPIIISNKVNTWPYVEEASAGLILEEPGIEVTLGDSIVSLLQDVGRLRVMGKRGQKYARRNLTWSEATSTLMNCYADVLGPLPSPDPAR